MCDSFANVPDAVRKIVFDRFHVMGHMVKAVDTVRKQEHRSLRSAGNVILKQPYTFSVEV